MKMLKAIRKIQNREHISHVAMAKILGITTMHWWRIRVGKCEFRAEYKEIALGLWQQELLPIFLAENVTKSNKSKKAS